MVDIIIRAKNGHEMTARCVASIVANTPEGSFRLILVDDGSEIPYGRDGVGVDMVVSCTESKGSVTATNLGLAVALMDMTRPYVMVLDNDTRIPEGDTTWLERFVRALEQEGPGCACVGATTSFANPPQHVTTVPETYTGDWENEKTGAKGFKLNPPAPWFVSFACLLRKSVVLQVGFWDERYNPGNYEDTDYAVQLRTAGYTVKVAQSVYIHHDGHRTFSSDLQRLLNENGEKFREKWGVGRLFDLGFVDAAQLKAAL